ncbi:uncharacterized protein LOC114574349 [Exaiptasia diaphana]|uniref:C-type lectin domain-containing protein n=1 Tax=Exaiptasia diaphana TaxID=2652724 RepID=A0A913YBY1_EXADI|nr:uncharacterized protein LOC114574349 [Exaiptasia diaphana]
MTCPRQEDLCATPRKAYANNWYRLGSFEYENIKSRKNWEEANSSCSEKGGALASIDSDQELRFITEVFLKSPVTVVDAMDRLKPEFYWKLDGSDKDIVLHGDAEFRNANKKSTAALRLKGTADSYATTPVIDIKSTSFTITLWVRFEGFYGGHTKGHLFSYWDEDALIGKIFLESSSSGIIVIKAYFEMAQLGTLQGGDVKARNWYHIAFKWNRSSKVAKLFQNGVKVAEKVSTSSGDLDLPANSIRSFDIGYKRDAKRGIIAKIARLAVFTRSLSASNIDMIYNTPKFNDNFLFYEKWIGKKHAHTDFNDQLVDQNSTCVSVRAREPYGKMDKIDCDSTMEFICKKTV